MQRLNMELTKMNYETKVVICTAIAIAIILASWIAEKPADKPEYIHETKQTRLT